MNKVVIHIGLHKTATTYLQTSVFPYAENFTLVTRPYTQLNHALNKLQYADDSIYNEAELHEEIESLNIENLILSDESFSGKPVMFSYVNRSMIAARLARLFPEAQIILFIRDQKDIMVSHYSSYIKMPYGTKKIEGLFRRPDGCFTYDDYLQPAKNHNHDSILYNTSDFHISLESFKYARMIEHYQSVFKNLNVFTYEDFEADQSSIVSRIESIIGESITPKSLERENVSLSGSMLVKMRIVNNLLSPNTSRYIRKAANCALKVFPPVPSPDLNAKIDEHVLDFYHEDNLKLKLLLPEIDWDRFPDKYA